MNTQDANNFLRAIIRKYPALNERFTQTEIKAEWLQVFGGIGKDDAYRALQEIYQGDHDKPFPDDWPATISRLSRGYASERKQEDRQETDRDRQQREQYYADRQIKAQHEMIVSVEPVFREMEQYRQEAFALEALKVPELVKKWRNGKGIWWLHLHVMDEFRIRVLGDTSELGGHGKRYDCNLCWETGVLVVWQDRAVRAAIDGEYNRAKYNRTTVVSCTCKHGDKWRGIEKPLTTYDESKMMRVKFGADMETAEADLFVRCGQLRPLNWSPEIDAWNNLSDTA